ncbi:hypothetical protein [Priestia aryabhattai]|uniref:hypothetical protein n=1 Tax=Priestia aryabhattai TaxID=412384 RepID=UPI001CFE2200|nr:hypothetical protein [Priestia aryabhattai]
MKELFYYLSENPNILDMLKEEKVNLLVNPDWGIDVETIIEIMTNNEIDIKMSYWK